MSRRRLGVSIMPLDNRRDVLVGTATRADALGYDGWVSLEYKPSTTTEASLGWLKQFGYNV